MDCSKTEVFFTELFRLCNFFKGKAPCPLLKAGQSCPHDCFIRIIQKPAEAIKIVQEWSDTHPIKTRLSVLKEQYPTVRINPDSLLPEFCAGHLYGFVCVKATQIPLTYHDCRECWNTPIEEGD